MSKSGKSRDRKGDGSVECFVEGGRGVGRGKGGRKCLSGPATGGGRGSGRNHGGEAALGRGGAERSEC